ncbi:hypothetical protein JVT61DRAFT_4983 [Boletus reticuloceps]|uniref:Uncharacterized protein n=1 Tax=Boletus reticuloceps TaxID=495285 RepID=A0A8I2Z1N7_9AGAM|nr:hypothetical protein JVT61DRAFT_4983 [Boletus reticuloceps]
MILIGTISILHGLTTMIIGKGRLIIKFERGSAPGAPLANSILMGEGEVVVIKGK